MLFLAQDKIVKLGILNAMSEERLDRIEALIEKIGQKVESNAKSIEVLTHSITEEREQRRQNRELLRRDRAHVFEWMSRLAAAQADFYESQADYHKHLDRLDDRLTDILDRITRKDDP